MRKFIWLAAAPQSAVAISGLTLYRYPGLRDVYDRGGFQHFSEELDSLIDELLMTS